MSAYGHSIRHIGNDHYRLSWVVDRKYAGSRLRFPTEMRRDTDEKGARRFAKKWDARMPEPKQSETPRGTDMTMTVTYDVYEIAQVCHAVNRAICEAAGDTSQKQWDRAEQWQRDSAVRGVEFAIANPEAPADAQHNAWMADKLSDGWTFGAVKDASAKTHPCLVPYDELPFEQRVKDHAFRAVVAAMATA